VKCHGYFHDEFRLYIVMDYCPVELYRKMQVRREEGRKEGREGGREGGHVCVSVEMEVLPGRALSEDAG
jgi:hypothetical protein